MVVIIYTLAYNAGKTLRRTIESVLAQTHKEYIYYLVDNASTDNTYNIIQEYALRDWRIIPLQNEKNRRGNWILDLIQNHPEEGYLCALDADDEYEPEFLEKMLVFVTGNRLDVATCGTGWINGRTGEVLKNKVLDQDLILEGREFADQFPVYRNYMVTVWGALFSLALLRKCDLRWAHDAMNFFDTAFCMETFRHAKRAGVLSESLHRYYVSEETGSYRFNPDWFRACKNLHKISRLYLRDYGRISKENENYLWTLFLILIKYILPRIQNADVTLEIKLKSLYEIFTDHKTRFLLKNWEQVGIYSNQSEFLHEIKEWIYYQDDWEEWRQYVEDLISVMDIEMKGCKKHEAIPGKYFIKTVQ